MRDTLALQLVGRRLLSGPSSPKEAFHLTFERVPAAKFDYQCGDSVAFLPENEAGDVEKILAHFHIDPTQSTIDGDVRELFLKRYCVTHLGEHFWEAVGGRLGGVDREKFDRYRAENVLQTASLCDVIDLFPSVKFTTAELLPLLKKMQPRLYSIASMAAERMDLAVVVVRYGHFMGGVRYGVASHYLCHRLPLYWPISAFIARSNFRLPGDASRDIIMVGPGTGIAPFRAFLQERAAMRAAGKTVGRNWLFFGEQYRASNFYYREEFERWQFSGDLAQLDLAFSRDQDYKIYVQDRMRECGGELWNWLARGAYFYICGEAAHMAKDVESVLLDVIHLHGGVSDPENFLKQLKRENRYQRDVY